MIAKIKIQVVETAPENQMTIELPDDVDAERWAREWVIKNVCANPHHLEVVKFLKSKN